MKRKGKALMEDEKKRKRRMSNLVVERLEQLTSAKQNPKKKKIMSWM